MQWRRDRERTPKMFGWNRSHGCDLVHTNEGLQRKLELASTNRKFSRCSSSVLVTQPSRQQILAATARRAVEYSKLAQRDHCRPKIRPKAFNFSKFQQYPDATGTLFGVAHQTRDICDSSMIAEVSVATASALREKALLEYQESRSRGAAWLWKRAIERAGGSRTILLFVVRLWSNYTRRVKARRVCIAEAIHNRGRRRWRAILRAWSVAAHIQRLERKLCAQKAASEQALTALSQEYCSAGMRADQLASRVRHPLN